MKEVLLADHPKTSSLALFFLTLGLPGTGLIIRPINSINMNFPSVSLGPIRCHIDGSNLAVHGDLELVIIPTSSLKLMGHTGNPKGSMFGMQGQDIIQCLSHILMVILYHLPLIFLALG